jgi:osmotically-inducible protein OsmY
MLSLARDVQGGNAAKEMAMTIRRSDSDIQLAVLKELDLGVVTLTGTVSSWPKRTAAQEAAHRVFGVVHSWSERKAIVGAPRGTPGVREVADHLRVEPFAA